MKAKSLIAVVFSTLLFSGAVFGQTENASFYVEQGNNHFSGGDYQKAAEAYTRALELEPDNVEAMNGVGEIYFSIGEYAEAESNFSAAIKANPNHEPAYYKRGRLYQRQGQYEKAIADWTKVLELNPGRTEVKQELAAVYYARGNIRKENNDTAGAIEDFELARNLDPEDLESRADLGKLYYDTGNYSRAIPCFLEAKTIVEKQMGKDNRDYASCVHSLGLLYYYSGAYTQAEPYFLEAKDIRERVIGKDNQDYMVSLDYLSSLYNHMADYSKAEQYLFEAKGIYEKGLGKDNQQYAVLLNQLGNLNSNTGNYTQAEAYYLEAKDIRERIQGKEHLEYTKVLSNLGSLYTSMGSYIQAEKYLLEAKSIRERTGEKEHSDYADLLNSLGQLYRVVGDYNQSEQYLLEAKDIYERIHGNEHQDYAKMLNSLAQLYQDVGDYNQSEQYLLEAKAVYKKIHGNEHLDYAMVLNNLGSLFNTIGNYKQAEIYLLEAKTICERVLGKDNLEYATAVNNLGLLYQNVGDYNRSEQHLLEAKAVYERIHHPNYAKVVNNLGTVYEDMEDYEQAETYYLEAKDIYEMIHGNEHHDYAGVLNNLGSLFNAIGNYKQAEIYYLEAKTICERVLGKDNLEYATAVNNLGSLFNTIGNYKQAEQYLLEAIDICKRVLGKECFEYNISLYNLSNCYLYAGQYPEAAQIRKETNLLFTGQVNRNFSFLSEQQRNAFWNYTMVISEASYSLSHFYPAPESNILNYNNALFAKGLLLRTSGAIRDAIASSGNTELIAQYDELGRLRRQAGALRQSASENTAFITELEQRAELLEKSLTQASAAFREFNDDLALDWQRVSDSLAPDEAAVEFVSFRPLDKSLTKETTLYAALVLRPGMDAPAWIPLCEEDELAALFTNVIRRDKERGLIMIDRDAGTPWYVYNNGDFYDTIWQPLEKYLAGVKTVYYSPSGLLHKVSFNAVAAPGASRLMDIYNLNLVSSTREIVPAKSGSAGLPDSAVIYGGLEYDLDGSVMRAAAVRYAKPETPAPMVSAAVPEKRGESWNFLRETEWESISIEQQLNEKNVRVTRFAGAEGNEESFKTLDGKKTGIIHMATHGFFIEDAKRDDAGERDILAQFGGGQKAAPNSLLRSGLILSGANNAWDNSPVSGVENGILFADDVARMNLLGAELVVLSACETALGGVNNSEGVFGLQRAFKLAGAETLIMSLWSVDDRATAELITAFYRNWLDGKSKQEAFKEAQRSMRSRRPQPYYWAAFVLMD